MNMGDYLLGIMTALLVVLLALILITPKVNSERIEEASELCKNNGGVGFVEVGAFADVSCKNGARFDLTNKLKLGELK